ncbi:hypothetical protein ES704_01491 [subsurface metagenome]|jgi:hypothetical protein
MSIIKKEVIDKTWRLSRESFQKEAVFQNWKS